MTTQFHECDARHLPLADGSVHACVTSPPYYDQRHYTTSDREIGRAKSGGLFGYSQALREVFREVRRVLRDDGTLILNIGDTYANKQLLGIPWKLADVLRLDGWVVRAECIWDKPNTIPDTAQERPERYHEHLFVFAKGPKPFWDKYAAPKADRRSVRSVPVKGIRYGHFASYPVDLVLPYVLQATSGGGCCGACGRPRAPLVTKHRYPTRPGRTNKIDESGKAKRDTRRHCTTATHAGWVRACECDDPVTGGAHATRPCVVLDPFAGTCTTALACEWTGRDSVMVDIDGEALAVGAKRLATEKPPKPKKVAAEPRPEGAPLPGQMEFREFAPAV